MVQAFKDAFQGEHLDSDAMPSIRLLSIVRRWFQPGNAITWVPWQLRLSAKQCEEIIQSKATKQIRTEAHLISTAFFDDTPQRRLAALHSNCFPQCYRHLQRYTSATPQGVRQKGPRPTCTFAPSPPKSFWWQTAIIWQELSALHSGIAAAGRSTTPA